MVGLTSSTDEASPFDDRGDGVWLTIISLNVCGVRTPPCCDEAGEVDVAGSTGSKQFVRRGDVSGALTWLMSDVTRDAGVESRCPYCILQTESMRETTVLPPRITSSNCPFVLCGPTCFVDQAWVSNRYSVTPPRQFDPCRIG